MLIELIVSLCTSSVIYIYIYVVLEKSVRGIKVMIKVMMVSRVSFDGYLLEISAVSEFPELP